MVVGNETQINAQRISIYIYFAHLGHYEEYADLKGYMYSPDDA